MISTNFKIQNSDYPCLMTHTLKENVLFTIFNSDHRQASQEWEIPYSSWTLNE